MDEILYEGHGWELRMEEAPVPGKGICRAARVHTFDSVHVLAFPDPEHVLLLREYRPFYAKYVWLIPSGRVDKGASIPEAAQRELQEETGLKAESLKPYFSVQHSEHVQYRCNIFIGRELISDSLLPDEHELIEVHTLTLEEALKNVLSSDPVHTVSALTLLRYMRENGK